MDLQIHQFSNNLLKITKVEIVLLSIFAILCAINSDYPIQISLFSNRLFIVS
jgi:hypothetical protein